jgi:3-oxoacyl-[acyl-carrier protein] reductase
MRAPFDDAHDEPGLLENVQVPRHRRLRDAEAARGLTHGGRPEREPLDDPAADRMGERMERTVSQYANNLACRIGIGKPEVWVLLDGKNAVIYGAGGAIGGAVARAFAGVGATVHLVGRRAEPLDALAQDVRDAGATATVATLDALDEHAVDSHADELAARSGSLDISLNVISHGEIFGTPLAEMPLEDYVRPIHTAARSTFLTARAAARPMIRQRSGVILTFGGYGRPLPDFYLGGFQVALTAVDALRRQLAAELGRYGIRVLTLQSVGIPETHTAHDEGDDTPPRLLARAPTLADVGNVAAFAASDHAAAITATAINITCGAEVD